MDPLLKKLLDIKRENRKTPERLLEGIEKLEGQVRVLEERLERFESAKVPKELRMYGCYRTHHYVQYEGCGIGSGRSETLLMVGPSLDDVRVRYNAYIKGNGSSFRLDYDPIIDPDQTTVRHAGSTGGGLARSDHSVEIREIVQVG